jgi:hypothetical protein
MRYQRHIVVLLLIVAFGLGIGVAFLGKDLWIPSLSHPATDGPTKPGPLEVHEALKVAVNALKERGHLTHTYEVTIDKSNTEWRCMFVFLPKRPGGHTMVVVGTEGAVRIIPGR